MLDDIDAALRELENTGRRLRRRGWWHRVGWRQVTAQLACVLATIAFVTVLLCYGR
ncbi:hypothetical protein [Streptomyces sp. NPDC001492]